MKKLSFLRTPLGLALAAALAACGGGSGGGGQTDAAPVGAASPAPSATPMSTLVVPAGMTWNTATATTMRVVVRDSLGTPVSGASVSVTTVATTSPHNNALLDRPVAMDRIDGTISDAAGEGIMDVRVPAHLAQVMVVATVRGVSVRKLVAADALGQPIDLQLAQ